ncbi:uncharacterized protein KY384_005037 [Bacidia gigantensis]|uniref:uncharacterized protein n=1 Tax=Bacidia gigantensis TaxID=2732470 RepID=UPI001D044438|nr:uncharacterized protein KY384_005037 [Bacidia gigantensis]KAG8530534.1 hypothetical protein KY384_005037 [Bacidia gigantensis]
MDNRLHRNAVDRLSSEVGLFYTQKIPFKIFHGYTHSTRKSPCERSRIVDTSSLCHVLEINTEHKTALVEPNVSIGQLVRETLKLGLIPLVVPEFPDITIGGGFAGTAGESSSFKYGFLHDTVNWIEIVIPNGQVLIASDTTHRDLFHGVKGTFGTLGVTTLLEIRLTESTSLVQLTYHKVHSIEELVLNLRGCISESSNDFVDAIQYGREDGVIVTAQLTNDVQQDTPIRRFLRPQDEWYYLHVQDILKTDSVTYTEAVPVTDYFFRYDRGAFWTGRYVFTYFAVPFLRTLRTSLDSVMHTKILYHGLHENGMAKDNIIQDVAIPIAKAVDFLQWLDLRYGIYPLWICPIRKSRYAAFYPMVNSAVTSSKQVQLPCALSVHHTAKEIEVEHPHEEMLLSIGVWGPRLPFPKLFVAENRVLEKEVKDMGGMKWLYAHNHYSKDEFWSIYDKELYDDIRRKYHAEYLPSVFEKTRYDWDADRRAIQASWLRWLFSFRVPACEMKLYRDYYDGVIVKWQSRQPGA